MKLYHWELGFPAGFNAPQERVALEYTGHAITAATSRRVRLPKSITMSRMSVIEIGVEDNKIVKMLIRGRLNDTHDICLVVIPLKTRYIVKTVWANEVTDKHSTLDTSKYERP